MVLNDAFNTDVRPLLAELREEMGLDPDPLAAYARSGYAERARAERAGGAVGWGAERSALGASAPAAPQAVLELLERSHRLGSDPKNTNYAGGNTSCKTFAKDPVTGAPTELL